jgi:hypothetical protein
VVAPLDVVAPLAPPWPEPELPVAPGPEALPPTPTPEALLPPAEQDATAAMQRPAEKKETVRVLGRQDVMACHARVMILQRQEQ